MSNNANKTVYVGLSGGVDSAVSAALLKEQGYNLVGVFMKNWSGDDYGIQADCPWEIDQKDAEDVCKTLGIEFRSYNFEKQYRDKVVEYFFAEYEKGRTPNPDVMCNKEIKFKLFLEKAMAEGADFIATGHYSRKVEVQGEPKLLKGLDANKDQTYFLYNLTEEQLNKVLFPVGELKKPEVRELARKFKLPNAEKPDSQGICFIGEINVFKFLMSRIPEKDGDIIDIDSKKVVGRHKGVYFYTIGQREGLRIGGTKDPYFVVKKDIENNVLYVGLSTDHPALFQSEIVLENLHLITSKFEDLEALQLQGAIRYRQRPGDCKIKLQDGKYTVTFDKPQRAVSSGQSLVLYCGEECLGGGIIE